MPQLKILCQTNISSTIVVMNSEISQKEVKPQENFIKEILKFAIIAFIIVVPLRIYIAEPFIVDGPSMNPTFATGQYLLVDRISYRFEDPKRNDVVIFRYPLDPKTFYIKRLIALPGETISVNGGKITIINKENPNGISVPAPYVEVGHETSDTFKLTLGRTEYFVMGDNRSQSSDSRVWGPVDKKYIVGRPFLRLLPFTKISTFPGKE